MNSYHLVLWVVLWLSKSFFLAASPTIESKNISHQEAALNNIIITFIAPPGGGKGTLSQQAEQHFNFTTVSTGNLCRLHKDKDSFLGEQMRNCLALGQLVPDTIISSMVQEWLIENADGTPIILDGYPRSPGQAQELLAMLKNHASSYSFLVIELAVPADSIVSRLSQRIVCSNKSCQRPYSLNCVDIKSLCEACQSPLIQRSDDTPEVIKNRMTLYEENAALITQYFSDNGIPVEKITITQESPQEVFELFKKIIHNVIAKKLSVQESKKELSKNNEQHRHYAHKELYTKLVKIIERLPHS